MELAYSRWGNQGQKLIFLHGLGGTGSLWRPIAASLEGSQTVLGLDQRGHGGSAVAIDGGFTPLDYGRDVVETMGKLSFYPAWVIGHSMGVRTACAAAHLKPEWVEGLVLIDLGFYGPAGGGLGDDFTRFLKKLPADFPSRDAAKVFLQKEAPDPSIAQYLLAVLKKAEGEEVEFPFNREALIETVESVRHFSLREWIREFAQRGKPVLALRGANSRVWSKAEFEAEKKTFADLPNVEFTEIAGAGHGLPFEKRAEFVSLILNLLTRHPQ